MALLPYQPRDARTKACTKCGNVIPISDFPTYVSRSRGTRRRANCRQCDIARHAEYRARDPEKARLGYRKRREAKAAQGGDVLLRFLFNGRLGHLRRETKTRNLPPLTVTADWLVSLYHRQRGRCYYTGETMRYDHFKGSQQRDSLSIDKLDPKGGYTEDNVVLCTNEANTAKGAKTLEQFRAYVINLHSRLDLWGQHSPSLEQRAGE